MAELRTASAMLRLRDLVVATSKTWLTARLVAMKSPLTEKASPPRATSPKAVEFSIRLFTASRRRSAEAGKYWATKSSNNVRVVRASVKNEKVMMANAINGRKDKAVK